MKTRDLFIICLALVVSVSVAIATRYILRGGSDATANVTKVMVAAVDLPIGQKLDKASYRWQDWPTNTLQPVYVTENNTKAVQSMEGSMVREHIHSGEPILQSALAGGDKGYLSALIGQNKRAFTIPLDNRSNISGKVLPADFVDVIVARREQQSYVADTVVRKVKVLEISGEFDPNKVQDNSKPTPNSITLEVSPQEAELLAAALREGTPVISLHSMNSTDAGTPLKQAEVKVEDNTVAIIKGGDNGAEVQKFQMKG